MVKHLGNGETTVESRLNSTHTTFPATTSKKNNHVQSLRGLAIILVVLGHVIGSNHTGGMKVSDDSIFRYLYYTLEYIRMPLFTVISGWVYANKPIIPEHRFKFIKGKLRRLIIPMFVISTLLFLSRVLIPYANESAPLEDLSKNLFLPYDIYWYLYALFLIFLLISVLDTQPFFRTVKGWALSVIGAFGFLFIQMQFLDHLPNLFSWMGAAYLLPFFLLGIGTYRYPELLLNKTVVVTLLVCFTAGIIIQQMAWFGYFPIYPRRSLLGIIVGVTGVLLLFKAKFVNNFLSQIGNYAYSIFLFHVFFTGGTRIILMSMGVTNKWIILIVGLVLAIFLSILCEKIIYRFNFLRLFLLGLNKKPVQSNKLQKTQEVALS